MVGVEPRPSLIAHAITLAKVSPWILAVFVVFGGWVLPNSILGVIAIAAIVFDCITLRPATPAWSFRHIIAIIATAIILRGIGAFFDAIDAVFSPTTMIRIIHFLQ
jgi:hypothetical protein